MVRAWIADIRPLLDTECYEHYYRQIPDFRREKADALKRPLMKAQSVGVWVLWQNICRKYGLDGSVPFNLSHSGEYVMCAACVDGKAESIGCDLEKIGPVREKVARRFFCPEEYDTIMEGDSEQAKTERFYRYWVLKESFMKATGKGMALAADSFCIRLANPPFFIRQPEEFPGRYYYMEYRREGLPYCMAVCAADPEIDPTLYMEFEL